MIKSMQNEIYKSPDAELFDTTDSDNNLATRWQRLSASMLDGLVMSIFMLPAMYLTGGFDQIINGIQPSIAYSITLGLLGALVFFLVNSKFLIATGQTLGKKYVGIKIVDLEGRLPTLRKHLILRYAFYLLPGQIPIIGQLISSINILFIFGKSKRCLHDRLAGTRVVVYKSLLSNG